jgi:hypothetical protein
VCDRASNSAHQQPRHGAVVFAPPQSGATTLKPNSGFMGEKPIRHLEPWSDSDDQFVAHFFSTFLTVNDLTGRSWRGLDSHLNDLLQNSSALRDVAIALAALDSSRMPHSTKKWEGGVTLKQRALTSYSRTIRDIKGLLASPAQLGESWESATWVTFFLGIFEVSEISIFPVLGSAINCLRL